MPNCVEIEPVIWRRGCKCENVTGRRIDGGTDIQTTDKNWSEKSIFELPAQVSLLKENHKHNAVGPLNGKKC